MNQSVEDITTESRWWPNFLLSPISVKPVADNMTWENVSEEDTATLCTLRSRHQMSPKTSLTGSEKCGEKRGEKQEQRRERTGKEIQMEILRRKEKIERNVDTQDHRLVIVREDAKMMTENESVIEREEKENETEDVNEKEEIIEGEENVNEIVQIGTEETVETEETEETEKIEGTKKEKENEIEETTRT